MYLNFALVRGGGGGGGLDADVHIDPREEMLSATVLKILLKASSFLFRH